MVKFLLNLLLLIVSCNCVCQNLGELDKRNGFKNIKLGSVIDSVKGFKLKKEFKERDEYPAKLYEVEHPDYEKVGEVKVSKVELKTYKDLVYEINVIVEKDSRLMKALESLYGKAEYDMINETYFWKTDNMILKFKSEGRQKLQMLYISYRVHKLM
ncbi:MAG TPA: hypothetical protein VJ184_02570, partial [Chryseolinea sp.]|nr:hypothetical protein [Chryseolinea sp.]